jgi:hypothetical protein
MDITIHGTIDTEAFESIVRDVLSDEGYMTHDGVDDQIQEYLHDNDYVQGDALVDEDDVERLIDKALDEYSPEDHLNSSILDEGDVERIVDEKIDALNLDDAPDAERINELERRMERYAQHVDELRGGRMELIARVDNLTAELASLRETSARSLSFFSLMQQAFNLLRQEVLK